MFLAVGRFFQSSNLKILSFGAFLAHIDCSDKCYLLKKKCNGFKRYSPPHHHGTCEFTSSDRYCRLNVGAPKNVCSYGLVFSHVVYSAWLGEEYILNPLPVFFQRLDLSPVSICARKAPTFILLHIENRHLSILRRSNSSTNHC